MPIASFQRIVALCGRQFSSIAPHPMLPLKSGILSYYPCDSGALLPQKYFPGISYV